MAGPGEAFVLAPGEGRSIDLGAFGMTVEASWDETAIRRGEVDESGLADVARRHSMEIVGPVPESYA